ncbi:peptidylprolyl isomerase [Acidocella aminolytica]|uniref:Parvulin-like PPIase n=1 Tax=Acidocella aminolytica 101 = DSM 11237 TaxID=1120923 RepID=A0A0D6PK22_9PROT|nr:peptidylprolyl isomerase [Acidocella aminolytica]GAN81104.1 peptidyl-prolyl cis-trans isomerase PpiC [Acidocella aminolytica 101 = DSM 11237]GBQ32776.1 parvulin-like peptidyl-prolyl isomerase [Acidocella aminolytica 101 = DSM 11237]SHF48583.1 peptidyl-prolyl cis-trans isomerase C [Acidocella aminolytica 101 = DSM 11237]
MSVVLSEAAIAAELQHHPAPNRAEAWRRAELALRLRDNLLAEAKYLGIAPRPGDGAVCELEDESLISQLLERHVQVPDISDAACRAEYDRVPGRFRSPALFEAAHILIAADMTAPLQRETAREEARRLATLLGERPGRFAALAREHSACPTGAEGGVLGQITARDVTPEIATMLQAMTPGTICPVPVPTRHGYHILRLDQREDGRELPYEAVRETIRERLRRRAWAKAARAYTATLINVQRSELDQQETAS